MKVKNIAFSGIMAAILMGASGANAAVEIASKQYVLNQVGDKATTAALESAQTTLQGAIDLKADQTALDATNTEVAKKANAADVYTITQADEKFQTIAKAAEDATAATNYTNTKVQELADTLGGTGEDGQATGLVSTVTAQGNRISGLETLVGDKSVADQIATSLTDYAKTSYVDSQDAATLQSAKDYADGLATNYDAAGAADTALSSAKTYTNEEIAKLSGDGGAIKTLETTVAGKADASTVTTLSGTVDGIAGRVTTAEGEIDALQAADTAINDKIGTVAEGKTVVQMIADAQTAAEYDDAAVKADIAANAASIKTINEGAVMTSGIDADKVAQIGTNTTAIATLNGTGEGSVSKAVSDATSTLLNKPTTNTCGAESGLCVLTMANDGSLVWIDVTDPADAE